MNIAYIIGIIVLIVICLAVLLIRRKSAAKTKKNPKIIFRGRIISFENSPTLLHSLEQNGFRVNTYCRKGSCGSCKLEMKKGKVKYLVQPELQLKENEILPCCCVPVEDVELG